MVSKVLYSQFFSIFLIKISRQQPIWSNSSMAKEEETLSSSFYLHPNKNPSLSLVLVVLIGPNYHYWSHAMKVALLSKNKLKFLDGSILQLIKSNPFFLTWEHCNTMVLSWIMHSVSKLIAQSITWVETTRKVWKDLQNSFS